MSRIVTCESCGKQLKVKAQTAGRFKCPACGGVIQIAAPAVELEPEVPATLDFMDEVAKPPSGSAMDLPPVGGSIGAKAATASGPSSRSNTGLKLAIGGGAVAAVVVIGLLWMMFSGGEAPRSESVAVAPQPEPKPVQKKPVEVALAPALPKDEPLVKLGAGPTGASTDSFAAAAARLKEQQAAEAAARQAARQAAEAERLKQQQMQAAQEAAAAAARQPMPGAQNRNRQPLNADQRAKLQKQIDQAIAKGQKYLISQYAGGSSYTGQYSKELGHTALCVYALLKSGADPDIPEIAMTIEPMMYYASNQPGAEPKGTYNASLVMLALDQFREVRIRQIAEGSLLRTKEEANRDRLRMKFAMRQLLVGLNKNQSSENSYSYGGGAGRGGHDMSLYQYALLGMWAANRAEVALRGDWWGNQAKYLMHIQNEDGSWAYKQTKGPTRSMTCAGLGSLSICYLMLHNNQRLERQDAYQSPGEIGGPQAPRPADQSDIEKAIERGFEWIEKQGFEDLNPYYLYSLERVCTLTKTQQIAGADWYDTLAAKIVTQQQGDGAWQSHWGSTAATAWTLLFLSRSTEKQFEHSPGDSPGQTPTAPEIVELTAPGQAPPPDNDQPANAEAPGDANAPAEARP